MDTTIRYHLSRIFGERTFNGKNEEDTYANNNIMQTFQKADGLLEALTLAEDKSEFGLYQVPNGPEVKITGILYRETGRKGTKEFTWSEFESLGRPVTFSEQVSTEVDKTLT